MKIENFGNPSMGEDVVTSFDPLRETKLQEKTTQIRESEIRIRGTSQHPKENGIAHKLFDPHLREPVAQRVAR